jgi:Ca-activated chloride channel family protein
MSIRNISLALFGALLAVTGQSEQPSLSNLFPFSNVSTPAPPVDPNDFLLSSHSDLVLLDVSIKDPKGGFVSGLTKDAFKVFDNNQEQEVRVFEAGDIPVTVGLVVDNSGSMRAKKAEVVTAALTFVTESNPKDEMFVVNFNDTVRMGLPHGVAFSDDRNLLRSALLNNAVHGRTALNDALKLALAHLEKGRRDKKTLILISDGGDNASELTQADIMHLAEESRATIYTIGIFDADDKDKNPAFLKKLAHLTGGECYIPQQLDQMVEVCRKIAKDVRNRYAVGFVPPASELDGSVRKLRVVASAPERGKLVVRTRTHYIATAGKPGGSQQ